MEPTLNIVEIASTTPGFESLVQVLVRLDDPDGLNAGLIPTLSGTDEFTVFAPTNDAFAALAADVADAVGVDRPDLEDPVAVADFLVDTLGAELVRDVILYHVAGGTILEADVVAADGQDLATLGGVTFTIDGLTLIDQEPDVVDPTVIGTDVLATNGVVHVLDRVLLPADLEALETLTGIVTADDGEFDILQLALDAAGLVETLDDPAADFTVFAPTDAAFVNLATLLGYGGDTSDEGAVFGFIAEALTLFSGGADPIPLLTDILLYHVSPGEQLLTDVVAAGSVETLLGTSIGVDADNGLLIDADPDLPDPGLVTTDVQATNGVAHVIDGVLIPVDLLPSTGANDVNFIIDGEESSRIVTGADNDLVDGNGGDDILHVGAGDDIALGGDGDDFITGRRGNDQLSGDAGDDIIRGQRGLDTIDGGQGDDFITAGAHNDEVSGGAGEDIIFGGSGRDLIEGGAADDTIFGQRGFDTIDGGNGDDAITGGTAADLLMGGAGDDLIYGQQGADTLDGGEGDDLIQTGRGADVLIFREGDGEDFVLDFSTSSDAIDVSDFGFADFAALESADVIEDGLFSATLDFGDDEVFLFGVNADDLTADNFIF